jgi:hypothetical protein
MKKVAAATALFVTLCAVMSCKKKSTDPAPIVPLMSVPVNGAPWVASLMSTPNPSDLNVPVSNVWGIFLITRLESGLGDTSGNSTYHYEDWQEAFFCGPDGTGFATPKTLSVNNLEVSPAGDHYFLENVWRSNWLNHWEAARKDSIPEVSANMMDAYPVFSAGTPANVYPANGLTYTFSPAQSQNADSGYVIIHANGRAVRSNTANVKTGTGNVATVTKDQLAGMHNEYFNVDNSIIYGGVIDVVVYKDTIQTFGGKQFLFRSQRQVIRKIIFK